MDRRRRTFSTTGQWRKGIHSPIEPALENIAQWRVEPARTGDIPVNTHFEFVMDFRPDHLRPPAAHTRSE